MQKPSSREVETCDIILTQLQVSPVGREERAKLKGAGAWLDVDAVGWSVQLCVLQLQVPDTARETHPAILINRQQSSIQLFNSIILFNICSLHCDFRQKATKSFS
jgi:hypothetical protein